MADDIVAIKTEGVDILEDDILRASPELLDTLLRDHTTGKNIFWATSDYQGLGEGYGYHDYIKPELITGEHGHVITPRIYKAKAVQTQRKKDKAEIFTPSWICNAQVNLIDGAWFGRDGVFNTEYDDHTWITNSEPIAFPEGKTWKDYVRDTRLEITCGEGPYMTSRYDATTGAIIPLRDRVGMVDRKLRVVGENTTTTGDWLHWAHEAFKNTYGYEWQGDSLLLARENMLMTFIEYYRDKFGADPLLKSVNYTAYIISWNVWQMDGLKGVVPDTCHDVMEEDLFGNTKVKPCPGCKQKFPLNNKHNGIYTQIMDWDEGHPITFISLCKNKNGK